MRIRTIKISAMKRDLEMNAVAAYETPSAQVYKLSARRIVCESGDTKGTGSDFDPVEEE